MVIHGIIRPEISGRCASPAIAGKQQRRTGVGQTKKARLKAEQVEVLELMRKYGVTTGVGQGRKLLYCNGVLPAKVKARIQAAQLKGLV